MQYPELDHDLQNKMILNITNLVFPDYLRHKVSYSKCLIRWNIRSHSGSHSGNWSVSGSISGSNYHQFGSLSNKWKMIK
jgi:hypothetical protein